LTVEVSNFSRNELLVHTSVSITTFVVGKTSRVPERMLEGITVAAGVVEVQTDES
jgi:hypothetical protein